MTTIIQKRVHSSRAFMHRARVLLTEWYTDHTYRKSLASVPEHLRYDVGIDDRLFVERQRTAGSSLDHDLQAHSLMLFR